MAQITENKVLRRLRSGGGIEVDRGDGLGLKVSVLGGRPTPLLLLVKQRFSDDLLGSLVQLSRKHPRSAVVLVVPRLGAVRREQLRSRGLSWIEHETGLVRIRARGLAIDLPELPSRNAARVRSGLPSLAGKAGVVVEALIDLARNSSLVSQPEVAELSGTTQAWTSVVFRALVSLGALEVVGAGPRKRWRPDAERLLDLWIDHRGPEPRRSGVFAWSRDTEDLLRRLQTLGQDGHLYALGGVAAAELYEPTLTSSPQPTVWISDARPPEDLARLLGGELVDTGANLVIWQSAGDPALHLARPLSTWREAPASIADLKVVSPARAAVEAIRAPGRGPEVGRKLRASILLRASGGRNGIGG